MKKAFLELHLSVILAGWTGIFGKLIAMSPGLIVFWRIVIAGALLWTWTRLAGKLESVTRRDRIGIMGVGALLMLQWTLFYAAIKASNVSIGVVAFSSIGFFTALIEPFMTHSRIKLKEIAFSLLTIVGIALIFHFDTRYRLGIFFGLASAAAAAVLAVFFRIYRAKYTAVTVMNWQLAGGLAAALLAMPLYRTLMPAEPFFPSIVDAGYLVIFASFCRRAGAAAHEVRHADVFQRGLEAHRALLGRFAAEGNALGRGKRTLAQRVHILEVIIAKLHRDAPKFQK